MRVVVHHPPRTEPDGMEVPASKSAYRLGRIVDHVDLLTGETTPREKVAEILLQQAKEEYPDCEVLIEHLHVVDRHPETNEEIAHEWRDHPPEAPAATGAAHEQELATVQSQEVAQ